KPSTNGARNSGGSSSLSSVGRRSENSSGEKVRGERIEEARNDLESVAASCREYSFSCEDERAARRRKVRLTVRSSLLLYVRIMSRASLARAELNAHAPSSSAQNSSFTASRKAAKTLVAG